MEEKLSRYIRESKASSQQDKVGLTIHFLESEMDKHSVETSEIGALIEESRIEMSPTVISARISDLKHDGVLTTVQEAPYYQYRLTHEGLEKYDEMTPELDEQDKVRDGRFIHVDGLEVDYYDKLVEHINKSYQYGINDGCLVLTRKLFENLVIDILRAEYGGEGIQLYFNKNNGRFHGLGTLCRKLEEKAADLKHYSRQLDNGLVDRVERFKEHGNSQAHSVRVDFDTDEIERMSEEATKLTKTLYDLREEVRIANGSSGGSAAT